MYHKVKIKKLPNKAVGGGINGNRIVNNQLLSWGGADFNMAPKKPKVTNTISGVPRDKANLEAEGGETVYGDVNGDGMAEHLTIKGPRHSAGGVPLNLPDGTFIFSDTKSMRIKDPKILANFGKKKGSYTPADLAKQYDMSKYRKILQDPDSDDIDRKTAEIMIRNYNMKLGALAIVQESKKGFPQGIPEVSRPYMEAHKLDEQQFMPQQAQEQQAPTFAKGGAKDPCPKNHYWNERLGACIPFDKSVPKQEEVFDPNRPMQDVYQDYLNKLNYKRNVEEYDKFRRKKLEEYLDNYKGPDDSNSDEYKKFFESDEYKNLKSKYPKPREGFQFPGDFEQKEYYSPQNEWDEESKELFNNFFKYGEEDKINYKLNQYLKNNWENIDWKKTEPLPYRDDERPQWYEQNAKPFDPMQYEQVMPQDIYRDRYDNWCPCSKMQERFVQGKPVLEKVCVPCEQTATAQYGYEMPFYSGDTMPIYDEYAYGGQLSKYQKQGEVKSAPKSKAYTKEQLPAGAVTRDKITTDTKAGDYVLQPDGTYFKVSKAQAEYIKSDTKSSKMSAADWAKSSPENRQKMDRANKLIEEGIKAGTITKSGNGIKITGDFKPSLEDRIILQEAFSNTGGLATDKYKVVSQKATGPYSGYDTKKGKLTSGSFVGGWTPEDHEQIYIYQKAKGQGLSHQDALAEVERVKKDPKANAYLRKEYAGSLGIDVSNISDEDIMKPDFFKKNYADITLGTEAGNMGLSKEEYRQKYGDDALFGWEHADARGASSKFEYEPGEEPPKDCPCEDGTTKQRNPDGSCPPCDKEEEDGGDDETELPGQTPPEWWLQDKLKVAGALRDSASIKKYMPWAPKVDLQAPSPVYLDPTRELAAQSEQANLMAQGLGQFAGPQAFAANMSGMQGNAATQAANTLSKYNNANVNLANQFGWKAADVANQEQLMNQGVTQRLYDQTTLANQQYDNAKRAARNNVLNQYISGITNKEKTNALNQMYPNFQVSPRQGGRAYFKDTGKTIKPSQEQSQNFSKRVLELKNQGLNDDVAYKTAMQESGSTPIAGNSTDAYNQQYGFQKKGGSHFAYVMGANVFPPFFY